MQESNREVPGLYAENVVDLGQYRSRRYLMQEGAVDHEGNFFVDQQTDLYNQVYDKYRRSKLHVVRGLVDMDTGPSDDFSF